MDISAFSSTCVVCARFGCRWFGILLLPYSLIFSQPAARGQFSSDNVLVVYNADDTASQQIASYYAQQRPGVQLLGLTGVTTDEQVSADYYLDTIRPQIMPALDDTIDVVVTTKGLPLRIKVNQSNPGTYTDPFGVTRTVSSGDWRPYSSLESELARIDTISTWQQMGDQTTFMAPSPKLAMNPYFNRSTDFSFQQLTYRLQDVVIY